MSSTPADARQTKIFGIRIGLDPTILLGGLAVLTAFFLWFNLHGGADDEHPSSSESAAVARPRSLTPVNRTIARRSNAISRDRGILSMKPVDPTRGDIDPTLRLSLLERLKALAFHGGGRNLFDGTLVTEAGKLPPVPKGPIIPVKPLVPPIIPVTNTAPLQMPVHIPLKYYGFVKPAAKGDANRGFFMDGDNVLVGIEGDVLQAHYLIVSLTPNSARIEDTRLKQGQDIRVAPEAVVQ